jgi:peroxin-14
VKPRSVLPPSFSRPKSVSHLSQHRRLELSCNKTNQAGSNDLHAIRHLTFGLAFIPNMAREELVNSAVTFLQDPSTANAPLDKRIQFLQSKNLTQEEIDLALARAGDEQQPAPPNASSYYPPPQQQQNPYRRPPPQYGYKPYMEWQPPPPELPKLDWRDWFIMATVVGGASFGLYTLANRYIKPLIAPPTPPQLEQDKAAIDEQFSRAFALLDTLSNDTSALKQAEEARTQRLDTALAEVESVIAELKSASRRREDESRRISEEVRGLKDGIPKAIDSVREGSEKRLKELGKELGSLKLLMGNRFGTNPVPTPASGHGLAARQPAEGMARPGSSPIVPEAGSGFDAKLRENADKSRTATTPGGSAGPSNNPWSSYSDSAAASARSNNPPSPFGTAGKAAIPAWQMAAAKNQKAGAMSGGADGEQSNSSVS